MSEPVDIRQIERKLRQHVLTDRLLGADALPVGPLTGGLPIQRQQADSSASAPAVGPSAVSARPEALFTGPPAVAGQAMGVKPLDRETKLKILNDIDVNEVQPCTRCELCQSRTQTVFGGGDVNAGLMFIGEGPGQTEDELGKPFVGRAGELLTKMIQAMGLTREQVYITNVVKCRPPNNRTPTPSEVEACSSYLRRQILTIAPKVIVTLGGPAAKHVLQTKEGITRLRGQWYEYRDLLPEGPIVPVMPTFHPAYLLRAYTKENRARVWSDLQQAMQRL